MSIGALADLTRVGAAFLGTAADAPILRTLAPPGHRSECAFIRTRVRSDAR